MYNRLTEKDWNEKRAGYPWNVHPVKDIKDLPYYIRLADIEDKIETQTLIELDEDSDALPIKFSENVYEVVQTENEYNIIPYIVRDKMVIKNNKLLFYAENIENDDFTFGIYIALEDVGKTIFPSEKEAQNRINQLITKEEDIDRE